MHKMSFRQILPIAITIISLFAVLGQTSFAANNGTTTADFLNIGTGARAAALGGAFTAVADGPAASYWNPGSLTSINNTQVLLSHFSWYQDINYEFASLAHPVNDKITLAISAFYLNYGTIEGYDQYDNPTGKISSTYDFAAGVSGGYQFSEKLSAGLTTKYIHLSLAAMGGTGIAVDIGVKYRFNDKITIGFAAANFGSIIKFKQVAERLPASVRFAISIRPFGPLLLSTLELENHLYGNLSIKNGYELLFEEKYFIRGGFAFTPGQEGWEFGQRLSFGFGVILGHTTVDYAFSLKEKFSSESIHRFTFQFGF